MTTVELVSGLYQTFTQHVSLPSGYEWTPSAGLACVCALGLLFLLRGAKWAPFLAALCFAGLGGGAGAAVSSVIATPMAPSAAVGAVVAFGLGFALFRLWQAVLLGGCCAAVALSVYSAQLTPEISKWMDRGVEDGAVTLRPAGAVVAQDGHATAQLASLWDHLKASVPRFEINFLGLAGGATLVGLIFGWFLPRASRALWATTLGTLALGVGFTGLSNHYFPSLLQWFLANNQAAWGAVGLVWFGGLLYNFIACGKPKAKASEEAPLVTTSKGRAALA